MSTVAVCETFEALQGESTFAGIPCFFIRLSGCNLRCSYCDTTYAYEQGGRVLVPDLVEAARASRASIVEVTGGEPLLQEATPELLEALLSLGKEAVLLETNGSQDISSVPDGVVVVMDIKCPGSGAGASLDPANPGRLRPDAEVKFVIADQADYEWARALVEREDLARRAHAVLFSPVWDRLDAETLGAWIAEDMLPVRLQVQLHKVLGEK